MATDPLAKVRNEIGLRVAEIRNRCDRRRHPAGLHRSLDYGFSSQKARASLDVGRRRIVSDT